jgi:hypothetical protein
MPEERATYEVLDGREKPGPRTMTDFLSILSGGQSDYDLGAALQEVINSVQMTRKKATLSYSITVEPDGDISVSITDEIKTKIPKPSRGRNILFATPDGWVTDKHPKQLGLFDDKGGR